MGARKFSQKQIRYLWAVGYFRGSPKYKTSADVKTDFSPKGFKNANDVDSWARKNLTNANDIPQRSAAQDYQSGQFSSINDGLRGLRELGTGHRQVVDDLIEAIGQSKATPVDLVGYRGVSGEFAESLLDRQKKGILVGSDLGESGFASMTLTKDRADGYAEDPRGQAGIGIVFEIEIPKGTKGLYLNGQLQYSQDPYESEFLTVPGQKFQIDSYEPSTGKYRPHRIRGRLL